MPTCMAPVSVEHFTNVLLAKSCAKAMLQVCKALGPLQDLARRSRRPLTAARLAVFFRGRVGGGGGVLCNGCAAADDASILTLVLVLVLVLGCVRSGRRDRCRFRGMTHAHYQPALHPPPSDLGEF